MQTYCRPILLGTMLVSVSLSGWADVYLVDDENGVTHYTNIYISGDKRYKVVLRLPDPPRRSSNASRVEAKADSRSVEQFSREIALAASEYRVDEALIRAVIQVESGYRLSAISRKGAQGLMQLMPATAQRYRVQDPFDPAQSIRGGAQYLRDLMALFNGNLELVLAAYNAGEQAVIRSGNRIPPYPETKLYVPRVLAIYEKLRGRA